MGGPTNNKPNHSQRAARFAFEHLTSISHQLAEESRRLNNKPGDFWALALRRKMQSEAIKEAAEQIARDISDQIPADKVQKFLGLSLSAIYRQIKEAENEYQEARRRRQYAKTRTAKTKDLEERELLALMIKGAEAEPAFISVKKYQCALQIARIMEQATRQLSQTNNPGKKNHLLKTALQKVQTFKRSITYNQWNK